MLVVADTGPPHYLVLCGIIDLLPQLFGRAVLPDVVRDELQHARAPEAVRRWIANPPEWVEIAATPPLGNRPSSQRGAGERAVIAVALAIRADLVLIDDRHGAAAAEATGLRVIGTLGLIDRAARRGLVNLDTTLTALRKTNFYIHPELVGALLAQHRKGETA